MRFLSSLVLLTLAIAIPASAQPAAPSGQAVFDRSCAACHGAAVAAGSAPTLAVLRQMTPEAIVNSLTNGRMQVQGSTLTEIERRAVAEFIAGRPVGASPVVHHIAADDRSECRR